MAKRILLKFDSQMKRATKKTEHDAVMERVDSKGNVIGFSIFGVSRFKKSKPLVADLAK